MRSGFVSLARMFRIVLRTVGDDAQEPSGGSQFVGQYVSRLLGTLPRLAVGIGDDTPFSQPIARVRTRSVRLSLVPSRRVSIVEAAAPADG